MITPVFKLSQDDQYVYVHIVAPYVKTNEVKLFHDGFQFIFHCKPYYLRLELPGQVESSEVAVSEINDRSQPTESPIEPTKTMKYDFDSKELFVPLRKKVIGEHFTNLHMIETLLSGPKTKHSKRLVEVLGNGDDPLIATNKSDSDHDQDESEEFDWNIEQKIRSTELDTALSTLPGQEGYGFANSKHGILETVGEEFYDLVDIGDASHKTVAQRRLERLEREQGDFSDDHYLADLYDCELIDELVGAKAPWNTWDHEHDPLLTSEDRQWLKEQIVKRDFIRYDSRTKQALMLSVVDILYAYAYDLRTNDFEHTVESAWNIKKLSATLSWFEYYQATSDQSNCLLQCQQDMSVFTVLSCIRRSLIYPLYRNWKLAIQVAQDVLTILSGGCGSILKCFIDIHRLFHNSGENYYLLNELYISDYCAWLQQQFDSVATNRQFQSLYRHLSNVIERGKRIKVTKQNLHLELEQLERAAELAVEENELSKQLKKCLEVEQHSNNKLDSDDDDDEH